MQEQKHPFTFINAPLLDFSLPETRTALKNAFARVRTEVVRGEFLPIIGGETVPVSDTFSRINPSATYEVVGTIGVAGIEEADQAIAIAEEAQSAWAARLPEERIHILLHAADLLQEERMFFLALMAVEVGKPVQDGDGELQEAIDFLRYYAKTLPWFTDMDSSALVQLPGVRNSMHYRPLGVGVSIQPWNFPLAISMGPAVAALVMGNAVLYKPAEESSVVGYYMTKLLHRAGVPAEVLHYLPGRGEEVGNYLVNHPRVRWVSFTGSEEVGRMISKTVHTFNTETVLELPPAEQFQKVISTLETGGNGAIYIDADADCDEAVAGVMASKFSFQGQKCSALQRLFVHTDIYDNVVARLARAVESLIIGPPESRDVDMGPVISREAYDRLEECASRASHEGYPLAYGRIERGLRGSDALFVRPMIVGNISHDAEVVQHELFGPILFVFRVEGLEEAIKLTNNTRYGLTAGIYSRHEDHIRIFTDRVVAGNIYINKKITGAVTAQQPFGGTKMSGNGTKAGHWSYPTQFACAFVISENTARRGHAPPAAAQTPPAAG